MKKKILAKIASFFVAAACLFGAVGCDDGSTQGGGKEEPVVLEKTAGYGQEFDLSTLDSAPDTYAEITVKDPSGERFALSGMTFVPDQVGVWVITFGDTTCNLTVSDVTAPVIHLVGQSTGYTEGDTVALPEVRVIDDVDGSIAEFTETLTYNGEPYTFSEEERSFTAATPGTYVYTATAVDKAGNSDSSSMNITVGRIMSREVEVGTQVAITQNMFADLLTDDGDYTFAAEIRKNGEKIDGSSFTVEKSSYYEVYASFTDNADASNVKYGYTVYYAEGTKIFLSDMTTADAFPTSGEMLRIDPWAYVDNRIENVKGNNVIAFTVSDDPAWREVYSTAGWSDTIRFSFPPVLESVKFGVKYDITFDLCFEGELTSSGTVAKVYTANMGKEVKEITTSQAAGENYSDWSKVTLQDITIPERVGGDILTGVFSFEIVVPNFQNGAVGYIDNITYILKEEPSLTAESTEITYDEGEIDEIVLTAEGLGISGTDGEGAAITDYDLVSATFLEVGAQGSATALEKVYGDKIVPESGNYTITLRGTDQYGNASEITVIIHYDSYFTPILTSVFDAARLSVAPNTSVTLSPESLGVSIVAATGYEVTYEISKNGAVAEPASGSFTVESGAYYEVCLIVTDEEQGTNRRYVTYKASDSNAITFEDLEVGTTFNGTTAAMIGGIGIYDPNVTATVAEDAYGRKYLRIEGISDATQILFPVVNTSNYGMRFSIFVEGTLGDKALTFSGNTANTSVTETEKWISCDCNYFGDWGDGNTRLMVVNATEGMTVYLDNIVLYTA